MRIVAVIVDEVPVASATCSKQKVKRGGWCFVGRPCFEEHCRPDWCPLMTAARDCAVQMVEQLFEIGEYILDSHITMVYPEWYAKWQVLKDEWQAKDIPQSRWDE